MELYPTLAYHVMFLVCLHICPVHSTKNKLALVKLPFCTRNGKLLAFESVIFLDTVSMPSCVTAGAIEIFEMCVDQHVLQPPDGVIKCLRRANYDNLLAEKYYNMHRFYDEIFFPNIHAIGSNICLRDELVVYAIEQNDQHLNSLLKQYECIPSTPKGRILCTISSLVHPHGLAGHLFKPDDGRFPSGKSFQYRKCTSPNVITWNV